MRELAINFEQAFNSVGMSLMNDDFAAKLLAYVYVMGGGNESVTQNPSMSAGIAIAQQKFNLFGGEAPSKKGIELIKKYVAELENGIEKIDFHAEKCNVEWLNEIFERYDIRIFESKH